MEAIGAKFQAAREAKGYTIEQVARDTHISKRFLQAIELEDFDEFPGEPYLLGFLRSYAEFLDLDSREVVSLYRNLKLQEQPAPIGELLVRRSPKPYLIAAAVVILLGAAVAGSVLYLTGEAFQARRAARREAAPVAVAGEQYTMTEEVMERRFNEGDTIRVTVGDEPYPLMLAAITDNLTIETPFGRHTLGAAQEQALDINQDGQSDVRIIVREIASGSAVVRFDRLVQSPDATNGAVTAVGSPTRTEAIGSTTVPSRVRQAMLIAEFPAQRAITLSIQFTGPTMLRTLVDGTTRTERFFQSGQSVQVTAQNSAQLWTSNAGATRVTVEGRDITLGTAGQVSAALIGWVEGPGNARLELVPVY